MFTDSDCAVVLVEDVIIERDQSFGDIVFGEKGWGGVACIFYF